jgi:hypothetical protein
MDNNAGVLQSQPSVGEFGGFHHLKRIDETNTTPQRLKWLWDHMQECEQSFDDHTRGKVEFFLSQFQNPDVEFYEMGDSGLVIANNIIQGGGAFIHYFVWDRNLDAQDAHRSAFSFAPQKAQVVELFDYLFWKRRVHHIIGFIPSYNQTAIRYALIVGMRFEGEVREDSLYKGHYYNTHIYGILEQEYPSRRARLI